jgi:thioredoxin reductase (NADPH)
MTDIQQTLYDVIIIGGGPAGLAAGLYAARDRLRTLILEKNGLPGGQILLTEHIENYPGYERVGGPELVQHMQKQVEQFDAEIRINRPVSKIVPQENHTFEVHVEGQDEALRCKAVLLSPGSDYRKLGIPGEEELRQATRVSYCATCDGAFYRDKHVLCIGGGNTAVEDTVYLTRFAKKITMIHRRAEFRAQQVLVEELHQAAEEHDIDIKLPYVAEKIVPNDDGTEIDHVLLRNVETDQTEPMKVDGVFVFVGMVPNTDWLKELVEVDENGYVVADPLTMKTCTPGIFIAGDCRQAAAMQLATACADGVVAAMGLRQWFRDPDSWGQAPCEQADEQTPRGY